MIIANQEMAYAA